MFHFSLEICNQTGPGNIILCPMCDQACKYITLGESCTFARLTYLFDNPATVFFAIFMSFWGKKIIQSDDNFIHNKVYMKVNLLTNNDT